MWHKGWREEIWNNLQQDWDVIVVGGGITGAGVLRQATAQGLRTLLVEAHDFTFGTSSRSSKLVHGGFRYLREGQISVTRESVREREWLLRNAPHLVTKLSFLLADYRSFKVPMAEFRLGVTIYDLLAPKWDHKQFNAEKMLREIPGLRAEGLMGGIQYFDAAMDDSRIVLRILREAVRMGGTALNYAKAEKVLCRKDGQVCGVALLDTSRKDGKTVEVNARVVINACGPESDILREQLGGKAHIRKLRGSHLVLSQSLWPLPTAATLIHPRDHRALFVIPWEGASMIGTTDLDHTASLDATYQEPFASQEEIDYLLEALNFLFPEVHASQKDVLSTFAGVRPTIQIESQPGGGNKPSHVSRAHALYTEKGMLTITGGKYTTFRLMSRQAVGAALRQIGRQPLTRRPRIFDPLPPLSLNKVDPEILRYQVGRHGTDTREMIEGARKGEMEPLGSTCNTLGEIRWAAREEGVEHLDDLLLRRVRVGNLMTQGAKELLPKIQEIVQTEMGWSDARWQQEEKEYLRTWKTYYSPKPG